MTKSNILFGSGCTPLISPPAWMKELLYSPFKLLLCCLGDLRQLIQIARCTLYKQEQFGCLLRCYTLKMTSLGKCQLLLFGGLLRFFFVLFKTILASDNRNTFVLCKNI